MILTVITTELSLYNLRVCRAFEKFCDSQNWLTVIDIDNWVQKQLVKVKN